MEDGILFGARAVSPWSIFYPRFSAAAGSGVYSWEIEPRLTMYLMASVTDISSLVTWSSGTRIKKPDVGLGVVGTKTQTTFSCRFRLHLVVLFAGDEPDGIHPLAREIGLARRS